MEALREPILVFQRCSIAYGNKMPEKTKHYLLPFFSFTYPPQPIHSPNKKTYVLVTNSSVFYSGDFCPGNYLWLVNS